MALLTFLNGQLAYGHVVLLDHINFSLESRERVGLIGRNGSGKSSFLKILAGIEKADDGALQLQQNQRLAFVAQEPALDLDSTVFSVVSAGIGETLRLIDAYCRGEGDLDALQDAIEARDGWNWERTVAQTLDRLHLDRDALIRDLSGGTRKRVALAQALASQPDILLLDEPTNHLDLDSIQWLEELLIAFPGSVMAITHDRAFLDSVATRIVELDRGQLRSYAGNFGQYLVQKTEQLAQEAVIGAKADKLLAQEEIWIRKGVEARRTRSQSRISRLEALRAGRSARRDALGSVKLDVASGPLSGKLVAELDRVSVSFGQQAVVKAFTATILRGDKIGLIGPNGAGKTTLLKLILGELKPDSGTVRQGTSLSIAYFDQLRNALALDASLADFISPGSEWIEIGNQRKHVNSYLADFLFSPARANSPVRSLSGGERNRLLLARLFARPANVLVLDEPTNDLDIDTLELLEDLLQSYDGTVFLVSHDRRFLDNVVTSTIAFEGEGIWREYEGGIQDWLVQSERSRLAHEATTWTGKATRGTPAPIDAAQKPKNQTLPNDGKLSSRDQREIDALMLVIDALEGEQTALRVELSDSELYRRNPLRANQIYLRDAAIEQEIADALARWDKLASKHETATPL